MYSTVRRLCAICTLGHYAYILFLKIQGLPFRFSKNVQSISYTRIPALGTKC